MMKIFDNFWFLLILYAHGVILQVVHPHWIKELDFTCIFYHITVMVLVFRYLFKKEMQK